MTKETKEDLLILAHNDYRKILSKYSFFRLHNYALADDVVQDTFMRTWIYILKGGEINAMKSFLYHVINGLIIDEYRKKKTLSLDALIDSGFEPSCNDLDHTFNTIDGKILTSLIKKFTVIIKK